SVWQGCLEPRGLPLLASRLGMDKTRLELLLAEEGLFGSGGECTPYVGASGGEGGAASATFQPMNRPRDNKDGRSPILALRKTADGVTVTPAACDCSEYARRVLAAPARDITDLSSDVMAGLPQNVRWQLEILVTRMIDRL